MSALATRQYIERQMAVDPEGFRSRRNQINSRWQKANLHKQRAHQAIHRAVRSGRLVRPSICERCSVDCKTEASHDDYAEPLKVEWLCRLCHARKDLAGRSRPATAACRKGHLFDESSTYVTPSGGRQCRVCRREIDRRRRLRRLSQQLSTSSRS